MKYLNIILIVVIWILGVFSFIALLAIQWALIKQPFLFTPEGLQNYISEFGTYKELFGATVLIMATYFGLHRLNAATEANQLKIKSDRFSEWKTALDVRFPDIEKQDPYMKKEFIRARFHFYEQLHAMNFTIKNRDELEQVFNTHFQNLVEYFELMNNEFALISVYPNKIFTFSFDSFRYLFQGCVDSMYSEFYNDLKSLYIAKLPIDRVIVDEFIFNEIRLNVKKRRT
jgi:hypothetical protein